MFEARKVPPGHSQVHVLAESEHRRGKIRTFDLATGFALLPQILRASPGADSRDDSAFQHLSQNIFNSSRADIGKNLAYLGFRYREKAIQYRRLDT